MSGKFSSCQQSKQNVQNSMLKTGKEKRGLKTLQPVSFIEESLVKEYLHAG